MNVCILSMILSFGANPYPIWQNIYDGGKADQGHGLAQDSTNRIILVGETNQLQDYDSWLIALSKNGDSLWSALYDSGEDERGIDVSITREGSIVFTGSKETSSVNWILSVLYAENGNFLWEREINPSNNMEPGAITVSSDNRIYVAGEYWLASGRMVLRGYNIEGQIIFDVDTEHMSSSFGEILVDKIGYIYLGGDKDGPCFLRKFSTVEEEEYTEEYDNSATKGFGLALNEANHLFQSGDVASSGSNDDFLLLKWDTAGTLLWPTHKAYDLGHNEYCRDIKLDAISDCYLAGWQVRGTEEDAALVKTDSAGAMLWAWVDTMPGNQEIEAIEVDEDGYIYLAGSHHNGTDWDMLVMQVRQPLTISGVVVDSFGARMSGVPITLTGDTTVEVVSDTDGYYSITVYNGGTYTVKPSLPGWAFTPSSYAYSPLAHREWNQDFLDGHWTAIGEQPVTEAVRLEVNAPDISYALPPGQQGTMTVFDPSGRIVERLQVQGSGQVRFPSTPSSGVYFVRLCVGNRHVTKKIVIS